MISALIQNKQRAICSELENVELRSLYKATTHGFTAAAFHKQCDNQSPTVSVGYNSKGYVFGGYTRQPFSQSGVSVYDDQAFLFSFRGQNLQKHPVDNPANAVKMVSSYGPTFGDCSVLLYGSKAVVYSNPGSPYCFDAATMHGNDLTSTECEVYQVVCEFVGNICILIRQKILFLIKEIKFCALTVSSRDINRFAVPWRTVIWSERKRTELMEGIKSYKPTVNSVSQARVLLIGPVGAGKSSFFNSINSVFRGHVTSQAISGCSSTSLTTQFRTYSLKAGRDGNPSPIISCDTMGSEDRTGAGLDVEDISNIIKGHISDCYQFNPSAPLAPESYDYRRSPELKDKIHCSVYIFDATKVSIMSANQNEKSKEIRKRANRLGVPQLVVSTKVDAACSLVKSTSTDVYSSIYIKNLMQDIGTKVGVPSSCVVPVKNYTEELDLDLSSDISLSSAVVQMLRFADNFFDDVSDRSGNVQIKE